MYSLKEYEVIVEVSKIKWKCGGFRLTSDIKSGRTTILMTEENAKDLFWKLKKTADIGGVWEETE